MENGKLKQAMDTAMGCMVEANGLHEDGGNSPLFVEAVRQLSDAVDMLRELAEG